MKSGLATLLCGAMLVAPMPAMAAPATPAEASRLKSVFESYFGNGGNSGASPVAVTPRGEEYSVAIDIAQIARPLAAFGFRLNSLPVGFTISPQNDGMWRVIQTGVPEIEVGIKEQNMKLRFDGLTFDGIYNPVMFGFVSGKSAYNGSYLENTAPNFLNIRKDARSTMEMSGTSKGPGILSAGMRGHKESHSQTFRITQGASPIEIGIETGPINSEAAIEALRSGSVLDLWAFFVANPSTEALEGKLDQIKAKVRGAFPVFNILTQRAGLQSLRIATPVGEFGLRDIGVAMKVTGVHRNGDFGVYLAMNGITIPVLPFMPAWSKDLIPSDFVLELKAAGYDLEASAEEILGVMRAGVTQEESKAAGERAVKALAPNGKVKITMGPSTIVSRLMTISMEGEMTIYQPIPRGRLVVKAKGMEETIAALQGVAASDKSAQQTLMGLIAAKGFGKAEPDGTLAWVIENADGGLPTINGVSIPGMGGK